MKKLTALLICLIAQTACAAHKVHQPFTGFYLTGAVGGSSANFEVGQNFALTDMGTGGDFPASYTMAGSSPAGLLGLSYLYEFRNHFLLGLEATAGYMNAKADQEVLLLEAVDVGGGQMLNITIESKLEAELTNDFALLFKPGFVSGTKTLFYALVGPRWGNFKISASESFSALAPGISFTTNPSDETSGYQLGVTAGAGIQHKLTKDFHLGLEYVYTSYGEIDAPSIMVPVHVFNDTGTLIDNPEIDASTNMIMLAFSYQW